MAFGRFLIGLNGFLGVYFLFSNFTNIKGYTYGEVLLCFAVMQMAFSLSECFAGGFSSFSGLVKRGEFDRILVRPCSPVLQILGSKFDVGRIGPMMTGIFMLGFGIYHSRIVWNFSRILTLIFMILGGMFLFAGLFMVGAAICFFSLEESGCMNVLTYGAKEHGKYPIDIYGRGMMHICTYIIPYTLIQYYPLQYLFGRTSNWRYALYPAGMLPFLLLCYLFFRFGMYRYQSSGS